MGKDLLEILHLLGFVESVSRELNAEDVPSSEGLFDGFVSISDHNLVPCKPV